MSEFGPKPGETELVTVLPETVVRKESFLARQEKRRRQLIEAGELVEEDTSGAAAKGLIAAAQEWDSPLTDANISQRNSRSDGASQALRLTRAGLTELAAESIQPMWLPREWRQEFVNHGEVIFTTIELPEGEDELLILPGDLAPEKELRVARNIARAWKERDAFPMLAAFQESDDVPTRRAAFLEYVLEHFDPAEFYDDPAEDY